MKRAFYFVMILVLLSPASTMAFRCGTKLISAGDAKLRVLNYCGEPDSIDVQEVRTNKRFNTWGKVESTRVIEVWTYNRGPYKFMAELFFSGNRLLRIEERERGFVDRDK